MIVNTYELDENYNTKYMLEMQNKFIRFKDFYFTQLLDITPSSQFNHNITNS